MKKIVLWTISILSVNSVVCATVCFINDKKEAGMALLSVLIGIGFLVYIAILAEFFEE